jgi:hypothetical protein
LREYGTMGRMVSRQQEPPPYQGPILQNFIQADNFSDKFPRKKQLRNLYKTDNF